MGNLGFPELVVILVVALFVLGPKRLPEVSRAMGEAVRAFRNAMTDGSRSDSSGPPADRPPHDAAS